jgi:hypothetical protein
MKFYSGFSLKNEECYFESFINSSSYTVCGFSYGAIKAFRYTKEQLKSGKRVDTLQLFSPAFFQTKSDSFKKLQLRSFSKNKNGYLVQFIDSCFYPHAKKSIEQVDATAEELEELLVYEWSVPELQNIVDKGVKIEVYLGGNDKIIDVDAAKEFFRDVATVTYIKDANHFLQIK